jgi:hypothetical protein
MKTTPRFLPLITEKDKHCCGLINGKIFKTIDKTDRI